MTDAPSQTNIDTVLLENGNIQFRFRINDADAFFVCSPDQAASLATNLLNAVNSSYILTQPPPTTMDAGSNLLATIPVRHWFFGHLQKGEQKFIGAQIGNTPIGFTVTDTQLRDLGRTLVQVAWKTQSSASSWSLLLRLVRDFVGDLRDWSDLSWRRVRAKAARRVLAHYTLLSGRSFRMLRFVSIAPGAEVPTYAGPNLCIYCGETVYSRKLGVRQRPLGAEHIVAEGLGGTLELPLSSCADCERVTGALVEGDVLGRTLKALRVYLRLKKKGSGPPPKTLPIDATVDGRNVTLQLPTEDYPIIFFMLALGPHNLEGAGGTPTTFGAHFVAVRYDQNDLFRKYRIGAFATPSWDQHTFARMLAKIGHSFAAAELKLDKFTPLLIDLIRHGDMSGTKYIGGIFDGTFERKSEALHELALGYQRIKRRTYVVVRIRLFAKFGGPTYAVIVGESSEQPMARAKRFFSNRISRMLAR